MKYQIIFRGIVAASFSAPSQKRAQMYARALVKFMVRDIKPADKSEVTKEDFRLKEVKLTNAGPKPITRVIPSNPNYKSKFAPVRVKS
jgi:hypothetical protein